jgi:serine/threonine protein kinase
VTGKGDLIGGRYRLAARVGRGAMGVVWQAHDERLDRSVAVKLLSFDLAYSGSEGGQAEQRVMREARIAAKLHHPNAVAIHDVVQHEDHPCLVMEYLQSQSLAEVVAERGALPADEVAGIGAQVAAALAAAHEAGIVHRDVKPENVLIAPDGTVKITDFGISRAIGDASMTATGIIPGTPAFLAPEVAGGGPAGFPSDVFSLGATLYAATEGVPPFGMDENAIALLLRVAEGEIDPPRRSGALAPLLLWLMRADPSERPTMRQAQEHLATGKPPPTFTPRTATKAMQVPRPRRRRILAVTAAVALLAVGLVVGLSLGGDSQPEARTPDTQAPATTITTTSPVVPAACEATYKIQNSWPDGYQAEVTIRNTAAKPLKGWTVSWNLPGGQRVKQLWNGTFSQDGTTVRVEPAPYNVSVETTTSFGFLADTTKGPAPVAPPVRCASP